jgi:hypothetical protein
MFKSALITASITLIWISLVMIAFNVKAQDTYPAYEDAEYIQKEIKLEAEIKELKQGRN